jgi:hypothetical protein
MTRPPLARLSVRDRLRSLLDERRWRDYARSPTSIFYGVRP